MSKADRLVELLIEVADAAEGDSNDTEIQVLRSALELALDLTDPDTQRIIESARNEALL